MRSQFSLDGAWQFFLDKDGKQSLDQIHTWRTIQVPAPWQAQFDDLRLESGVGWYRRSVHVPSAWRESAIFLCFGAADYFAEVSVNGQLAGSHEGGYLPFEMNISALVTYGQDNEIVVRVVDPSKENDIFPEFPFAEIPHGKQSWYGPIGGLWQSVFIEVRSPQFIRYMHATPHNLEGEVSLRVGITGESTHLHLRCISAEGEETNALTLEVHGNEVQAAFTISSPRLWELESPHLYTLDAKLYQHNVLIDQQQVKFGVRTFEARDGKLWLNGKLFYMRGALDQDYYPEGIYTPPSLEFLREQVRLAKSMGLNLLRCHIKIADPRYLQAADEEGILVWAEVPSWGRLTEKSGQRVRDTFTGMVARDWNHPSIVIWTIVNEDWGTDLPDSASDREWLDETFQWAKTIDPSRLIVDNSPCPPNFHLQTDIDDFHFYAGMPEGTQRWQEFVTAFAHRPTFTFSPHSDAVRHGQEPLIVSEFGNWGLPDLAALKAAYGGEVWWFDTGKGWIPDVVHPLEAENRFLAQGLEAVFGDWQGLAKATQWAEYQALKYEIETMRAEATIQGYVITEWTDLHWECNGLVDMARNPRIFAEKMGELNAETIIIPRWQRLSYQSGQEISMDVLISHQGASWLDNLTLNWWLEGTAIVGVMGKSSIAAGEVSSLGSIRFDAPSLVEPQQMTLHFAIENKKIKTSLFLTILPQIPVSEIQDVRVVTEITPELVEFVRQGGAALACLTEPGEITGLTGVQVEVRAGTAWSGDWASSFAWIRPEITRMPTDGLLDFTWQDILPRHVLTGIAAEHTYAGLFVGWLHQPAALIGRIPVGEGRLTLTTLPLLASPASPVSKLVLQDLLNFAQVSMNQPA